MTAHARQKVFALNPDEVTFAACWSGYWDNTPNGWDAGPIDPLDPAHTPNTFKNCTIAGVDPRTNLNSLACPAPATTLADDQASDLAAADAASANQVTVYACYVWRPPLLGDLIGSTSPCALPSPKPCRTRNEARENERPHTDRSRGQVLLITAFACWC